MRRFARDDELTDNQEGKVPPDYMAEVMLHTERRVREYAAAERRLEAARKRHEAALARHATAGNTKTRKRTQAEIDKAWDLVEERLRELRVLERLMTEVPASRDHRGTGNAKHRSK